MYGPHLYPTFEEMAEIITEVADQEPLADGVSFPEGPYVKLLTKYAKLVGFNIYSSRLRRAVQTRREIAECFRVPASDGAGDAISSLCDGIRTTYMLKALRKAIHLKAEENGEQGPVSVLDLGAGTGIFLLAALVFGEDRGVKVTGVELQHHCTLLIRRLFRKLNMGDQYTLWKRDVSDWPWEHHEHVVISEHLSDGLFFESADLVRYGFRDPLDVRYTIPYAVTPVALLGVESRIPPTLRRNFKYPKAFSDLQLVQGQRVVLADRSDRDGVLVEDEVRYDPGKTYVAMGTDIEWASPTVDPQGRFKQSLDAHLRRYYELGRDLDAVPSGEMFASVMMNAHGLWDLDFILDLSSSRLPMLMALENASNEAVVDRLKIEYPFAAHLRREHVRVESRFLKS